MASIPSAQISLTEELLIARLSVVKGQPASRAPTLRYERLGTLRSPVDL